MMRQPQRKTLGKQLYLVNKYTYLVTELDTLDATIKDVTTRK